jgi:release factor glutamine methyltransferase
VREALDSALVALEGAGVDTPRLDAEVLLARALGVDRGALAAHPDRPVEGHAVRWFRDAVRRRSAGREPVAYITGTKGFRHLELQVDPRVLVPRPETEHLVEAALELAAGTRVHDVGTGSGAVALALKQERPDLLVSASDVSRDALDVARANAAALGLDVAFARADLLEGTDDAEAVVANLPYIPQGAALAPEIARHEPPAALFGGPDGLDLVRRLVAQLPASTCFVALEVGAGQASTVGSLFVGEWVTEAQPDLAGIERVVVARR